MGNERRINLKYFLITAAAVFLSFELHEFCHYLTGEYLGNRMAWTLNSGYPLSGSYLHPNDYMIVSAAGPAFTIIQGLAFYFILRKKDNYYLYPFLFMPFFMRFSAMVIGFRHLNDEARISADLGIGSFTLPLIVSFLLFYFVFSISRQYHYRRRLQGFTFLFVLLFYSLIILTDKYFHVRIL